MFQFFKSKEKKIEEAKNKLILDLKNADIDFVLTQIENEELYSPLIETMASNDYISWYAYERAREYHSPADKLKLLEKLSKELNPIRKSNLYYCLSHLCYNTNDHALFNFLMEKLESEDTKSQRNILLGIQDMNKASELNIEPLKNLIKSGDSTLYTDALFALRYTNDPEVEGLLLATFEETKNNVNKGIICATLRTIGSKQAIPILNAAYQKTKDKSLRWSIEEVISSINERESI